MGGAELLKALFDICLLFSYVVIGFVQYTPYKSNCKARQKVSCVDHNTLDDRLGALVGFSI